MLLRLLQRHGERQINFVVGDPNGLRGYLLFFGCIRRISETECRLQRCLIYQLGLRRGACRAVRLRDGVAG